MLDMFLSPWVYSPVIIILAALLALGCTKGYIHMLQLESYQLPGYFRWFKQNDNKLYTATLLVALPAAIVDAAYTFLRNQLPDASAWWGYAVSAVLVVSALIFMSQQKKQPAKKLLVYTARVKRLVAAIVVLEALVLAAATVVMYFYNAPAIFLALRLALYALVLLMPFWVALAAAVMQPIERAIAKKYFKEAQRNILENEALIRIGITGSYGKTSTKFILGTILGEKYRGLVTPSSYNTPMGVTRVIREQLMPDHEVFIAEMGARHVGDIKEMCELVKPMHGLLTSIGPQHLETFGSIENVAATKYELMEALPENGIAIFPDDGAHCTRLYTTTEGLDKALFGVDEGEGRLVWAKDLSFGPEGSRFTLCTQDGQEEECTTQLLGRHNVQNIVGCAAMALKLGLTLQEIAKGIAKVEPVEHRLQLIPGANGVTVIDDAFNANPAGARMAMEVLGQFPGRHIVITPGMVELGEQETKLNRAFGEQMASAADIAILVGEKRTRPIVEGLLAQKFDEDNIKVVANLEEATQLLGTLTRAGDVVLFENDLPDNYNE